MEDNNRIVWLDYAKVIGLYLVIAAHLIHTWTNPLRLFIYSFHMPLFFFLSGYLHKKLSVRDSINNGFKKLLIPFLCFLLLFILVSITHHFLRGDSISDVFSFLIERIEINIMYGQTSFSGSWFLLALFFDKIICDLILQVKKSDFQAIIVLFVIIILLVLQHFSIPNILNIKSALMAFPFYFAGFCMKKYKVEKYITKFRQYSKIQYKAGIILVLFVLTILGVYVNGRVSYFVVLIGKNIILCLLTSFFGILMVVLISKLFKKQRKYIELLSAGSLVVFLTHFYLLQYLGCVGGLKYQNIFKYIDTITSYQWINHGLILTIPFLFLIIEIPIVIFFNKYLSFMLGGRKIKN